jgi:hypothetical protein
VPEENGKSSQGEGATVRHLYKGPRPITEASYLGWLSPRLESGEIGRISQTGVYLYKNGLLVPWVEDERPEPKDPLESQETDGTTN